MQNLDKALSTCLLSWTTLTPVLVYFTNKQTNKYFKKGIFDKATLFEAENLFYFWSFHLYNQLFLNKKFYNKRKTNITQATR